MTPKQKRAIKRAKVALLEMSKITAADQDACNVALGLLLRTAGCMIGGTTAMHNVPFDQMADTATRAARILQQEAAEAYAQYLCAERKNSGGIQ